MRALVCLLLCAGAARADMSLPAKGNAMSLPATDGKRIVTFLNPIGDTTVLWFVDARTGRRHSESVPADEVARRLADFRPMKMREVLRRDDEEPTSHDYDAEHARLRIGGRTLDLTIRDTCFDQPRERSPRTVTVYSARGVELVEYWTNYGSCMCDDPTESQVVARGHVVAVVD
jgi:hypothetical protein